MQFMQRKVKYYLNSIDVILADKLPAVFESVTIHKNMGSVNQLCNYQYQEIPEHKNFIEALNQTLCILHSTMDVAKQQSDTHNSNG